MEMINMKYVVASVVYSFLGIAVLVISFVVVEKITPQNLWKEIVEKQNKALAIMAAAFMIAIALIISSAIHG
jgi:putative membrane protein